MFTRENTWIQESRPDIEESPIGKVIPAVVPEEKPARKAKMQFVLMGFHQVAGLRSYAFQGLVDGTRTDFEVGVDLALTKRYGIRIQELPLLCRELLERQVEGGAERTVTFTESDMCVLVDNAAMAREAAERKKRPARRPPASDNAGAAWRAPLR